MKTFTQCLLIVTLPLFLFSQEYDDVYFSPDDLNTSYVQEDYEAHQGYNDYDEYFEDDYYLESSEQQPTTESYQDGEGNTYITNNYYGDYYDYGSDYSSRIKRYYEPYWGFSYYSPCYSNYYYGNYGGYYSGWSVSFGWSYPYYSYWYPYSYYGGYYAGGGYYGGYNHGYYNGYYDGYWHGYNDGYYGGYYGYPSYGYGGSGSFYGPRYGSSGLSSYRTEYGYNSTGYSQDNNHTIGKSMSKEVKPAPSPIEATPNIPSGAGSRKDVKPSDAPDIKVYENGNKVVRENELGKTGPEKLSKQYTNGKETANPLPSNTIEKGTIEKNVVVPKPGVGIGGNNEKVTVPKNEGNYNSIDKRPVKDINSKTVPAPGPEQRNNPVKTPDKNDYNPAPKYNREYTKPDNNAPNYRPKYNENRPDNYEPRVKPVPSEHPKGDYSPVKKPTEPVKNQWQPKSPPKTDYDIKKTPNKVREYDKIPDRNIQRKYPDKNYSNPPNSNEYQRTSPAPNFNNKGTIKSGSYDKAPKGKQGPTYRPR